MLKVEFQSPAFRLSLTAVPTVDVLLLRLHMASLRIIPMTLLSASPSSSSQAGGGSGWLNALEEEDTP